MIDVASLALGLAFLYVLYASVNTRKRIPPDARPLPGPQGAPWLGPFWNLPVEGVWHQWCEWAKEFGPIYQMTLMGVTHVIVTKEDVAHDLLAKRGAIYSDRGAVPSVVNSKSTLSHGDGAGEYLPLMGRNEFWARQRKFAHGVLATARSEGFSDYPLLESRRYLYELMKNPASYSKTIENFTSRIMCRLIWADPAHGNDLQQSAWQLLVQMSPAGPLTNRLTPLLWLPRWLSPWMSKEKKRHDAQESWFLRLQRETLMQMAEKRAKPSFMKTYFQTMRKHNFQDEKEAAFTMGMLGVAGVFTMGSPLHTFILAMVLFPQWLKPMQEEMDRELGGDRPPEAKDYPRLPFLRAVIMECIRWRPAVPTGVAHEAEQDDVYNGYHIPKGALVHPVQWAFSRDESKFPDAETFNPMRWLEPSSPAYKEPLTQYPTIQNYSLFGFGRRTCMGQDLTENTLLKRDSLGREIDVPMNAYNSLLIIKPDRFDFELVPRSEKHARVVEQRYEEALRTDPHAE
ncbi:cytochrome P450 [Macrophomina phaseolina]|uniref:Cytochrome P450 n=1 Tax=Macrophomina phaseolina TaxID=35725 RepID=A0ABQ8GAI8_9PEZI|nr:cytochrome P450 [Macrophomina phaseolina]